MVYIPDGFHHIGIFGTTGTGKSYLAELLCELGYLNEHKKIVDLTNDRYIEVAGFLQPNRRKSFQGNILKASNGKIKAHGFPTEIFHPIVNFLPEKLPPCMKMYSIPMDFFAYEEVLRVLTNDSMGDASYVALAQEIEKLDKTESLPAVPNRILETVSQKVLRTTGMGEIPLFFYFDAGTSATSANRPLLKAKDVGIFSSANFDYALSEKK